MISVVIPTFMEEKYIGKTLESIKNQNFKDFETIVVDSKSTDRTVEISKKYADKVFVIGERGIGKARNFGASKAKSDVLVFVDADTKLSDRNLFQKINDTFKDTKVVCFSGNVQCIGKRFYKMCYGLANAVSKISLKFNYPLFYGMTIACRKKEFLKIGGFDEKIKIAEDMDLSRRINKKGKCVFENKVISHTVPRRLEKMGMLGFLKCYGVHTFNLFFKNKPAKEDAPVTR